MMKIDKNKVDAIVESFAANTDTHTSHNRGLPCPVCATSEALMQTMLVSRIALNSSYLVLAGATTLVSSLSDAVILGFLLGARYQETESMDEMFSVGEEHA